jgi:hypothetical protein
MAAMQGSNHALLVTCQLLSGLSPEMIKFRRLALWEAHERICWFFKHQWSNLNLLSQSWNDQFNNYANPCKPKLRLALQSLCWFVITKLRSPFWQSWLLFSLSWDVRFSNCAELCYHWARMNTSIIVLNFDISVQLLVLTFGRGGYVLICWSS